MWHRGIALLGLLAVAGCAGLGSARLPLGDQAVELTGTTFFPQQAYQCGPAALATVLDASGVRVHPDELAAALYLPERQGTLQVELEAAARRQGRLAVVLEADLPLLVQQLRDGRPVLVLQNLAVAFLPVWHYAVVVGYEPDTDRFVLRSGTTRRELTGRRRFQSTWRRGGYWALVVLAPEADPTGLPIDAYLEAAADLENTGAHELALTAFRSASKAWPVHPMARLGEANNLYYLGRHEEAAEAFGRLLDQHPDHLVAVHNLTILLLEMHRPCEARAVVAAADSLTGALMDTARRAVADACPAG